MVATRWACFDAAPTGGVRATGVPLGIQVGKGGGMASASADRISQLLEEFHTTRDQMLVELSKVVVGQREVIELILAAIFTRGHCLLVGVPGLAKTLMVSSIARILDVGFKRIQFTPDLMPSDITGTNVLEEPETGRRTFRFIHGPIFSNIILADEINRTPPKTQAALLQAMQEREVTVGQETMSLPEPFLVIATQNPIEQEGTYPLPEAQLDRFMFDIRVGYPTLEEEEKILSSTTKGEKHELGKMLSGRAILNLQKLVTSVPVSDYVIKYVARLVRATRPVDPHAPPWVKEMIDWGAGPRAGQALILGGKAMAAMDGRYSVALEDVRKVAVPVLRHRIAASFKAQGEGLTTEDLIRRLLSEVKEPEIPKYERR
ncbi:ATPase associated with various cellular activities AAA_3 [Isosphaera pallida ATCC 43644]|uniref:ATPase associated with various cellular activities AAA_3 n=2 Tax=Isosphaera pallida TaxID=128 RepID=E8QYN1_ISOPI|nr:ATPase associated with various cellular activities AAA_3 [Isosphaera pallida ATCC 43644]